MTDNDYPAMVFKKDLYGLERTGSACEVCGENMHEHEWVLMDKQGFVVFCCNLTFKETGKTEVHFKVWYEHDQDGGWESPASYQSFSLDGNPNHIKHVIDQCNRDMNLEPDHERKIRGFEVWSQQETVFLANEIQHTQVGVRKTTEELEL